MAKIFNGPTQLTQQSLTSLCESFLNLNYKKRPAPAFAVSQKIKIKFCIWIANYSFLVKFTEAKIAMALFKQW